MNLEFVHTFLGKWMVLLLALNLGTLGSASELPLSPGTGSSEAPSKPPEVHYEDAVIVLNYHHIDASEATSATISPIKFLSHMQMLKDHDFSVITMSEFIEFAEGRGKVPANAVLITFDDGYESFYTYAYPILKAMGYTASNFIVVRASDNHNPYTLAHLTWEQMRELKEAGFGIYNHTYGQHSMVAVEAGGEAKYPALTSRKYLDEQARRETYAEYLARIREDLSLAEKRLQEELGEQERLLAFPYGAYNNEVIEIGKELDISLFFTTRPGMNRANNRLIYRLNAGAPDITADELLSRMQNLYEK